MPAAALLVHAPADDGRAIDISKRIQETGIVLELWRPQSPLKLEHVRCVIVVVSRALFTDEAITAAVRVLVNDATVVVVPVFFDGLMDVSAGQAQLSDASASTFKNLKTCVGFGEHGLERLSVRMRELLPLCTVLRDVLDPVISGSMSLPPTLQDHLLWATEPGYDVRLVTDSVRHSIAAQLAAYLPKLDVGQLKQNVKLEQWRIALSGTDRHLVIVVSGADKRPELGELLAEAVQKDCSVRFFLLADNAGPWWNLLTAVADNTLQCIIESSPIALPAPFHVFVSHAGPEKEDIAIPIATGIGSEFYDVFLDRLALNGGDRHTKMLQAIKTCSVAVVVISQAFLDTERSRWPTRELGLLLDRAEVGITIVPVMVPFDERKLTVDGLKHLDRLLAHIRTHNLKTFNWANNLRRNDVERAVISHAISMLTLESALLGLEETMTAALPAGRFAPSALLVSRYAVVPYQERADDLMRDLLAFGTVETQSLCSLFVLYGAAGEGKTRLLIEVCKRLRNGDGTVDRVDAQFLKRSATVDALRRRLEATSRRLVVVIDYADSRENLGELLAASQDRLFQTRIVLLAREGGDWWSALQSQPCLTNLCERAIIRQIMPVAVTETARSNLFNAAQTAFADRLQAGVPTTSSLTDFRAEEFSNCLNLLMLALHPLLLISETETSPMFGETTLTDKMLSHEVRFWTTRLSLSVDQANEIAQLMGALTLLGGAKSTERAVAIMQLAIGRLDKDILESLRRWYPNRLGGIGGLEPDMLGEELVFKILTDKGPLASTYLSRLFSDDDATALECGFALFARLSLNSGRNCVHEWIDAVLEADVPGRGRKAYFAIVSLLSSDKSSLKARSVYTQMGRMLVHRFRQNGTDSLAIEIIRTSPLTSVALLEVKEWAGERMATSMARSAPHSVKHVRALLFYSRAALDLGKRDVAYAAASEALTFARTFSSADVEHRSLLARAAHEAATCLNEVGEHCKAAQLQTEAVSKLERLCDIDPSHFSTWYAASLVSLSKMQLECGEIKAAEACLVKAVAFYRQNRRPGPDLARALHNLAVAQSSCGMRASALNTAQEAVTEYRNCANQCPDAYLLELGESLVNLSSMLSDLYSHPTSLSTIQEAVLVFRRLALTRPLAFLHTLSMCLTNLSTILVECNQDYEVALVHASDAVQYCRDLERAHPGVHQALLALCLNNLGTVSASVGQHSRTDRDKHYRAAVEASMESVSEYRSLMTREPGPLYLPKYAGSLLNLGFQSLLLNCTTMALSATNEAVTIYRKLTEQQPNKYAPFLAKSLHNHAILQYNGRNFFEATESIQEAVNLLSSLALQYPHFQGDLDKCVTLMSYVNAQFLFEVLGRN